MHCYFVDGIFVLEFRQLMKLLGKVGLGGAAFDTYLQSWSWPKAYASAAKVCHATGSSENIPNGTASEYLLVAPVLQKFLEDVVVPTGTCAPQVRSALLLLDVVDFLSTVHSGRVQPACSQAAIVAHSEQHQVAYGVSLWKPKHHFAMHLPKQLQQQGHLLATLLMERKHRVIKRMANPRFNTVSFDRGIIEDVIVQHLHVLQQSLLRTSLVDARPASKKLSEAVHLGLPFSVGSDVKTSREANVIGRRITLGDVDMYKDRAAKSFGEVYFHVQVGDQCYTCVSPWAVGVQGRKSVKCGERGTCVHSDAGVAGECDLLEGTDGEGVATHRARIASQIKHTSRRWSPRYDYGATATLPIVTQLTMPAYPLQTYFLLHIIQEVYSSPATCTTSVLIHPSYNNAIAYY